MEVASGMHDASADPSKFKCRTLSGFRINLKGIPHEKEHHESSELLGCEMPGE